jgi:large subunit ribosomal protein L9
MKIILKENIENLGKRGDVIDVADGYGRNYLLPRKLAIQVTPSNMKMVEMEQIALRKKLEQEVKSFQSVIERLNQMSLSFERKAGDKDVIFGSVSTSDIKEALDKQGIEVEKKRILLVEPIKRLGNYTIPVKIFHDERAEIKVEVKKEGAEEEEKEKKPTVSEEMPSEEVEGKKAEETQEDSAVPEQETGEEEKAHETQEKEEAPDELKELAEEKQEIAEEMEKRQEKEKIEESKEDDKEETKEP